MAINDNQKPSRSKHRRNSDDETEEASKRHKHRHHHHHHRRHRSKKHENTDIENAPPAVVVSNGDYDMEEGEMVDDDCEIGGYTNNHSDQITVGVEAAAVDSDRVVVIVEEKVGNSGDDGFNKGNPTDVGKGETSVFTEICCNGGIDLNSIIQDVALLHKQTTTTHSDDHETMSIHQLDNQHQHGGRHSLRDKKREHSSSYYSRHNIHTNDSSFRDKGCEGNRDRNIERERKRARGKEMERERERDRERRRGRRDREGNRIRVKEDDRDIVYRKHHNADNIGDRERHSDRRPQRPDDKDYRNRARDIEKELIHTHKTDNSETNTQELHRDEDDEQEDYKETSVLQFAEQEEEEEDLKRIKEESRRRRQAILEIYKSQQSQQKHEQKSEEGSAKQPSITVAETHNGQNESAVMFLNETSFSLGKSPEQTEPPALKSSGTGALGEGTPKSERSDDMLCDTIFGASPAAGVRKQGKGDGFKIERSGLLPDNWDDAEGYYCHRLGEVLGNRYEVIGDHGKGMYSNVVCARDLKAGYGNPEKVAIKILRSNDTMYKAGLQELDILKKLIGADVEDRRHCVRLLSSFKCESVCKAIVHCAGASEKLWGSSFRH